MKFSHQIYEIAIEVRSFRWNERKYIFLAGFDSTKKVQTLFLLMITKRRIREKRDRRGKKEMIQQKKIEQTSLWGGKEESGETEKKRLAQWHKEMTVGVEKRNSSFWLSSTHSFFFLHSYSPFILFISCHCDRERVSERSRTHSFHQVKMKTVYRKGTEIKGKIVCVCVCERERERARTHNSYLSMLYWLPVWCVSLALSVCVFYVYGMNMIQFGWVRFSSIRIGITNTQQRENGKCIQGNRYYAMLIFWRLAWSRNDSSFTQRTPNTHIQPVSPNIKLPWNMLNAICMINAAAQEFTIYIQWPRDIS